MRIRVPFLVAVVLLAGIFFLRYPVLIITGLGFSAALFFLTFCRRYRIDRIGLLVLINFFYWLLSGVLLGAVSAGDLLSPAFYDGDGRVFLSYLPLLFFSVIVAGKADIKVLPKLIALLGSASTALFVIWVFTRMPVLSRGPHNFVGLLTSHTGAGTFFAALSVFLIVYGYELKRISSFFLGFFVALPLFGTGSREALVGFLTVSVWYVFRKMRVKVFMTFLMITALLITLSPAVAPHTYERFARLFSWELIGRMKSTFDAADWSPGFERDEEIQGGEYNVLSRMLFWGYCIKRFQQSPAVGIGFGRYNDRNLKLYGVPGAVYIAYGGEKNFAGHAHNSYLHILAESGLLGLVLLLWLWAEMYVRLKRAAMLFSGSPEVRAFYVTCQALVVFSLMSAFYGHALAAPSLCVPVLTLIGAGMACHRGIETEQEGRWSRRSVSWVPA